jgi:mannose-1-phosphate guanylyltransferase
MEGILLVGGLGTRLRPLTDNVPKPMLPVAGVPLIVHQIARLRDAGVDHVVLATSYRAEVFSDGLGDGSDLGIRISYAYEAEPLGTGGAIRHAAEMLDGTGPDDPVIIFNGDIIEGHDIAGQVKRHIDDDAAVTLYLTRVEDARSYGSVPTQDGRVTAFLEKTPEPVTHQINAGCYVFSRHVIDTIPVGRSVSVERETFPGLLADGAKVLGQVDDAYWRDLGTPAAYIDGSADVVRGLVDSPARPGPAAESLVLAGAVVDPSAALSGGTSVCAGARIAADARVEGSVILADAQIGTGAVVISSAVGAGAVVTAGTRVERTVVADGERVGSGSGS